MTPAGGERRAAGWARSGRACVPAGSAVWTEDRVLGRGNTPLQKRASAQTRQAAQGLPRASGGPLDRILADFAETWAFGSLLYLVSGRRWGPEGPVGAGV